MKEQIENVYRQIAKNLVKTPLIPGNSLDSIAGCQLHFKMENQQYTGSFKLRGVLSKFAELAQQHSTIPQVVAASTGNHALAVCHAAKAYQCEPVIFVPENVSGSKLSRLKQQRAEIYLQGAQSGETELIAMAWAKDNNLPMIHPYNDPAVMAGQGTIGLELFGQLDPIDQVFVPVGGGGLISGIAAYLKEVCPSIKIIGVQPKNASEMADSIAKGGIVAASELQTISDGTAGGIDPASITYPLCEELVDGFILVGEQEIIDSIRLIEQHLGIRVEPAAGLALAGILKSGNSVTGQNCVAIICGGNIDNERYLSLLNEFGY